MQEKTSANARRAKCYFNYYSGDVMNLYSLHSYILDEDGEEQHSFMINERDELRARVVAVDSFTDTWHPTQDTIAEFKRNITCVIVNLETPQVVSYPEPGYKVE
jgi:methylaspartate ammonia-lyase